MKTLSLGNFDCDVDVCATAEGWLVAGVPVVGNQRQQLELQWFDRGGAVLGSRAVYTGTPDGGTFARLAPAGAWIWLAHRAIVNGGMQATVRRVYPDRTVVTDADGVLGPADGPLALSGDYVAWHDSKAGRVYGHRLAVPLGPRLPMRVALPSVVGTGLAYLDGAWPVMVDDNRDSLPGLIDPVRRFGIVVGKNQRGGIEVRTGGPHGTLLPSQDTGDPRAAMNEHGEFAAVCWGGPGARLVLFSKADLVTTS